MALSSMGGNASPEDDADLASSNMITEINITPLTDIFLVLLIIFMVTSSVMSQQGVDVDLPQSSPGLTKAQPESVVVSLLPSGVVKVNDQSIKVGDWDRFKTVLSEAFAHTRTKQVILEGDRSALLGSAIELMDHAREAGASGFAIAASPQNRKRPEN